VRRFMSQHQQPGFGVRLFQPVHRCIRYHRCIVAFDNLPAAVDVEFRVPIIALAFMAHPEVKSRALLVVVLAHVPLADVGGFIAPFLEAPGITREFLG